MAKKILVVDDEPDVQKVLLLRLQKTGYEVFGAGDGQEALKLATKIMPDLMILDFYLPDMNGDGVVKLLKNDNSLKHIPIILMSATSRDAAEKFKEYKLEGWLNKPFEPEDLIGTIKRIIG